METENKKIRNKDKREYSDNTLSSGIVQKRAFTLAEVIITLIVIGVVAAITVPMMNNSVADKKWNVARQKAKATIGEAFKLMTINGEITTQKANGTTMTTADFVNTVIPKYLKLEKTCAPNEFDKCGFPSKVKTPSGKNVTDLEPKDYKWTTLSGAQVYPRINKSILTSFITKYGSEYNTAYFFRTIDGFSVSFFYNPYCVSDTKDRNSNSYIIQGSSYLSQMSLDVICLMGIYDMNGKQGPNKVGMDIGFIGSFYNGFETNSAAVLPHNEEKLHNTNGQNNWLALYNYCKNLSKDNDWIMPDLNESSLIYLNYKLVNNTAISSTQKWFFTRTPVVSNYYAFVNYSDYAQGERAMNPSTTAYSNGPYVRCVRSTPLK